MTTHICTHCGYEGKAVNPPSDAGGELQSETGKAFDRICRMIFLATFIPVKQIAQVLALPFIVLLWLVKTIFHVSSKKHCPHCGLPLMVSLKSDAGWLAKRKEEVKAGVVRFDATPAKPTLAFGKEVLLPEVENPVDFAAPFDEFEAPIAKLPSVDKILADAPQETSPPPAQAEPVMAAAAPHKKIDPDAW